MSLRNALLFSAIGLAWTLPAFGQGCQHDMQCKGDRVCNAGVCMPPDADGTEASASSPSNSKSLPTLKLSPTPQPPQSSPQPSPQSTPRSTPRSAPPPPPEPLPQDQPQQQHVSVPRNCCTVAGKLRLVPQQSGDAALMAGDACQGLTNSGKPVPGTACN